MVITGPSDRRERLTGGVVRLARRPSHSAEVGDTFAASRRSSGPGRAVPALVTIAARASQMPLTGARSARLGLQVPLIAFARHWLLKDTMTMLRI